MSKKKSKITFFQLQKLRGGHFAGMCNKIIWGEIDYVTLWDLSRGEKKGKEK